MTASESPEVFVASHPGVEAAVMRIGLNSTQVVFVAPSGEWLRFVVGSPDEARELCLHLAVEAHDGYPDDLRQRMGAYRRSRQDWASAPYPERTRSTSI